MGELITESTVPRNPAALARLILEQASDIGAERTSGAPWYSGSRVKVGDDSASIMESPFGGLVIASARTPAGEYTAGVLSYPNEQAMDGIVSFNPDVQRPAQDGIYHHEFTDKNAARAAELITILAAKAVSKGLIEEAEAKIVAMKDTLASLQNPPVESL